MFVFPLAIPLRVVAVEIIDGDLIKTADNPDVYIVKLIGDKKFKRLILNPEIFNKYGHLKWENIKEVSSAQRDEYKTSELVRAVGDDRVYKLYPSGDTGEKRWVETANDFLDLGYDWDAIYTINTFERDFYIPGEDLTAPKAPSQEPVQEPEEPASPSRNPIIIYVPSDYKTIQAAIDAAIDGDTISVSGATYNENITISKAIKLIGDFAESVIIDGQGRGPAVSITGASDFLIQRFTIKDQDGKGIYCSGEKSSKGVIKNVIFKNSGWGIFAEDNCELTILNNLIYKNKNSANTDGAGILIKDSFSYGITSEIRNNTIDANFSGIWSENANLKAMNNIISNNTGGSSSSGIYHSGSGISDNTFNDVWNNGFNYSGTANVGDGSIAVDPKYTQPSQENYILKTGTTDYSPCLDVGHPDTIYYDGTLKGNLFRNDMGAYGGPDNLGWNP